MVTVLRGADAVINPTMPLLEAGERWPQQIARPDSPQRADDRRLLLDLAEVRGLHDVVGPRSHTPASE